MAEVEVIENAEGLQLLDEIRKSVYEKVKKNS